MKKNIINAAAILFFLTLSLSTAAVRISYAAGEQGETARLIQREMIPPISVLKKEEPKKDQWLLDSFYEPSDIMQGNRTGHWNELTNLYAYIHQNIRGYVSVSQLERFDDKDYTANIGSYINLPSSYIHFEGGFGWKVNYIYKMQTILEYGHKLYENLYWQTGYNWRNYSTHDTHLVYPGLIYYFGDSYIGGDWGIIYKEHSSTGYLGTIKGNFALTKFLNLYGGVAVGQRLYDIYELKARKENGYILFMGLIYNIYKGWTGRFGVSYGTEQPKFIKRSLDFGLSLKF